MHSHVWSKTHIHSIKKAGENRTCGKLEKIRIYRAIVGFATETSLARNAVTDGLRLVYKFFRTARARAPGAEARFGPWPWAHTQAEPTADQSFPFRPSQCAPLDQRPASACRSASSCAQRTGWRHQGKSIPAARSIELNWEENKTPSLEREATHPRCDPHLRRSRRAEMRTPINLQGG